MTRRRLNSIFKAIDGGWPAHFRIKFDLAVGACRALGTSPHNQQFKLSIYLPRATVRADLR